MSYVVLAYNTSHKVAVVGNGYGKPFATEKAAEKTAERLQKSRPSLRTLVLEIEPRPTEGAA